MKRALSLAGRGKGKTFPNPAVGAVIVKNGKVVGEGWHRGAGRKHAEIEALEQSAGRAGNSVLYINLEPCAHSGRTAPCAPEIIKAGISRVICAMEDPDPRVSGKGFLMLEGAGVSVENGILRKEAEELNEAYIVHKRQKRPFVTLKSAMSLDGKTAARGGASRWITSADSRMLVHRMRASTGAVLTGIGTVLMDDPELSARCGGKEIHPYKVIVDSRARIPLEAAVFKGGPGRVIVGSVVPSKRLENEGVKVIECPGDDGRINLSALLSELLGMGIFTVLAEAGGKLNASLLECGAVDRLVLFYAPKILGGEEAPTSFEGKGAEDPGFCNNVEITGMRFSGTDVLIEGKPIYRD